MTHVPAWLVFLWTLGSTLGLLAWFWVLAEIIGRATDGR